MTVTTPEAQPATTEPMIERPASDDAARRKQIKWLATKVALDALRGELRAVIASTMQPSHVSIWTRAR